MPNYAKQIKKIREQIGLTPTKLADNSGLSLAYISKLESGVYKSLSLKTCKQLANGLGLTLKSFLESMNIIDNNKKQSGQEMIANAFRSNGYSNEQIDNLMAYAEFIKKQGKGRK